MTWLLLLSSVWARPDPCITLGLLEGPLEPSPLPPAPPGPAKAERDAYGLGSSMASQNFALRWGEGHAMEEGAAEAILEAFERTWEHQITDQLYPEPYGAQTHLFNVYVGDSSPSAPPGLGVSGYYSVDPEGWPMVVLGPSAVSGFDESLTTIPHEFFHAVQHSCDAYGFQGEGGWYWEATAVWMEGEVYPEDPQQAVFLFGFAFLPHYELGFYDAFSTGALQEYYQYGAFVFPRFLSEFVAGPLLVRDSWAESGGETDPLAWLGSALEDQGHDLQDVYGEFAARNAFWDYGRRDWYLHYLEHYAEQFPDGSTSFQVNADGSGGWRSPPIETLPRNLGYNHVLMEAPRMESIEVAFDGDAEGSAGSPVGWAAWLVRETAGEVVYHPLQLEGGEGRLTIEELDAERLVLSVIPLSPDAREGEDFAYAYMMDAPEAPDTGEEEPGGGCGCGERDGKSWLILPLLGISWTRRSSGARTR